jgi:hypothetical protein
MKKVRILLWMHVVVASYCLMCGVLDLTGHFRQWMIPSIVLLVGLAMSALVFPLWALGWAILFKPPRPLLLVFTHAALSFAQLFFGLFPLFT